MPLLRIGTKQHYHQYIAVVYRYHVSVPHAIVYANILYQEHAQLMYTNIEQVNR